MCVGGGGEGGRSKLAGKPPKQELYQDATKSMLVKRERERDRDRETDTERERKEEVMNNVNRTDNGAKINPAQNILGFKLDSPKYNFLLLLLYFVFVCGFFVLILGKRVTGTVCPVN